MKVVKRITDSQFVNESDEDLLVIISMKDDEKSSNLAFNEFHRRFKRFIFGMAIRVTANLPNSEELRDAVYQNTLISVFQYCDSFSSEGEKDPNKIRRRIHGWLVRIAKTELLALLRNRVTIHEAEDLSDNYLDTIYSKEEAADNELLYSEEIIKKALSMLKGRDQHVFMTYWLYYEPGDKSQAKNLPPNILEELAAKYETTPTNIRQIISRSKKKVFAYLKDNYKLKRK